MGLSELKAAISLENDSVASSERQRIMKWTVDDVMSHVRSLGCTEQAKIFADQVSKALFYRNDEDQFCLRFQANFFPQNFCYAYGKVLVIVIKRIRENGMREIWNLAIHGKYGRIFIPTKNTFYYHELLTVYKW